MAESKDPFLVDRQLKLGRQREILEQKRRVKQQQVHAGMIMASGFGSRPVSSRSVRAGQSIVASNNDTVSLSLVSDEVTDGVTDNSLQVTSANLSILDTMTTPLMVDAVKTKNDTDSPLISIPALASTNNDRAAAATSAKDFPPSSSVSLSEKLTSLGLSAAVGSQSDSSDDFQDDDDDQRDNFTPTVSPLHEVSVLPQEIHEQREKSPLEGNNPDPLDIRLNNVGTVEDLSRVVFRVPKESETVKCRITRDKQGLDKHMYPIYYLHMEQDHNRKVFLLAGRKKKRARSSYYAISIDSVDLSRSGESFVAKLRSNFVGTSFTAYDSGHKPPSANYDILREELVLINYETNVLGFKGPRKMSVVIPALDKNVERMKVKPNTDPDTLFERYKNDEMTHLIKLHNKQPVWSDETQAYVLNFHGRVTQASVKNFQLVHSSNEEYIVVQFGRISEDTFTLDYRFPMCAVQAFAIALSSFDSKWACE